LRRIRDGAKPLVSSELGQNWLDVHEILTRLSPPVPEDKIANWSSSLIALLGAPAGTSLGLRRSYFLISARNTAIIPFDPRSYRDFMLYEWHAVDAARGFVRHFKPKFMPRGLRGSTGKDFPR
jgi:hypothetical protein